MKKVVLDTNVLISAFLMDGGNENAILRKALKGEFKIYASECMLKEFRVVMSRPKFGYTQDMVDEACQAVRAASVLVSPKSVVAVIKEDPADNRVLECALEAEADCVVTGDQDLLRLGSYKGVRIFNGAEFVRHIGGN
ncbi:MAG: putative toxin-antitoxin system toxin component, PIN family [Candidatus Altiarchaeota archaeon]